MIAGRWLLSAGGALGWRVGGGWLSGERSGGFGGAHRIVAIVAEICRRLLDLRLGIHQKHALLGRHAPGDVVERRHRPVHGARTGMLVPQPVVAALVAGLAAP